MRYIKHTGKSACKRAEERGFKCAPVSLKIGYLNTLKDWKTPQKQFLKNNGNKENL